MNESSLIERLEQLLLLSQSGDATSAEIDEMNDLLRQSPEFRAVAIRFMRLEALLHEECKVRQTAETFQAQMPGASNSRLPHSGSAKTVTAKDRATNVSRPASPSRFPRPVSMLIAASSIGLLIASTLLFQLNKQNLTGLASNSTTSQTSTRRIPVLSVVKEKLATVTFESEAVWEPAIRLGDVLGEGELSLVSGMARLHTAHGVVLILDARTGPVRICLDGDQSVTVNEGTVLAKAHERALGFELRTPTTSVVDIGTEFSVSVDAQGLSNVAVLDGAVACLPAKRAPEKEQSMLEAGQSKRFRGPRDQRGVSFEIPSQLRALRSEIKTIEEQSDQEQLIAFESFDYPVGQMKAMSGGDGWSGQWHRGLVPSLQPPGVIREGQYLQPPAWIENRDSRYGVVSLASTATRKLSDPISLSTDGDVFISFMMRKRTVGDAQRNMGAGLSFIAKDQSIDSPSFEVSMDWNQRLTTRAGDTKYCGGTSIINDKAYFLVIKLEIRESGLDQIHATTIDIDSAPQIVEPTSWGSVSLPADLNGQIDYVRFWCGSNAIAGFDELRIGHSWRSVVEISK